MYDTIFPALNDVLQTVCEPSLFETFETSEQTFKARHLVVLTALENGTACSTAGKSCPVCVNLVHSLRQAPRQSCPFRSRRPEPWTTYSSQFYAFTFASSIVLIRDLCRKHTNWQVPISM